MKPKVPPECLRAARALKAMSQADVADKAGVTVRSVRSAETGSTVGDASNRKLRVFYESEGIEFLGQIDIGSGSVSGSGVRWWDPESTTPRPKGVEVTSRRHEFEFLAARNFLQLSQRSAAETIGIKYQLVAAVENYETIDQSVVEKILGFYKSKGIIFLGRRDQATNAYLGVGIKAA